MHVKYRVFPVVVESGGLYYCLMLSESNQTKDYLSLWGKLEISDYFLGLAAADIYDNISQLLTFIRIKISTMAYMNDYSLPETERELLTSVIGQTITELRTMCKLFYPDILLTSTTGFIHQTSVLLRGICQRIIVEAPVVNEWDSGLLPESARMGFLLLVKICNLIREDSGKGLNTARLTVTPGAINIHMEIKGSVKKDELDKKKGSDLSINDCITAPGIDFFLELVDHDVTAASIKILTA